MRPTAGERGGPLPPCRLPGTCSDPRWLERQPFEDTFGNMFERSHNVAPDFWSVEDIRRSTFESLDDIQRNLFGMDKAYRLRQMVGHRSLRRTRLDRDNPNPSWVQAAAKSL